MHDLLLLWIRGAHRTLLLALVDAEGAHEAVLDLIGSADHVGRGKFIVGHRVVIEVGGEVLSVTDTLLCRCRAHFPLLIGTSAG